MNNLAEAMMGIGRLTGAGGVLMAAVCVLTATAIAQEPLRWKFKLGDELEYHVAQQMTLTTSGKPLETRTTPLAQNMDMRWKVVGVNDDGEAVIEQKIDNVRLTMTGPRGEQIEYDSSSDDGGASLAAMVAPIYDALTEAAIEFTMTARGEIKDVKVPEEVLEALKNSPGASLLGDLATAEGIQRMITNWSLVLPDEAPTPGQEWESRVELEVGAKGRQIVESSYRFEGMKEIDGRTLAVFRPGLEMRYEGTSGVQTRVKEQSSSGELLFDPAAGRLVSARLERKATLEVTVAGETVEQQVEQSVTASLEEGETRRGGEGEIRQ